MGYDKFGHAGWVQEQIAYARKFNPPNKRLTKADATRKAAGKGWLAAPEVLAPWQARAITMLGVAFGGIYNAPIEWDNVRWDRRYIEVKVDRELATYDGCHLTEIVVMAHMAALRVSISPAMRHLAILIHEREPMLKGQPQRLGLRHPTFAHLVDDYTFRFPPEHPIWAPTPDGLPLPPEVGPAEGMPSP